MQDDVMKSDIYICVKYHEWLRCVCFQTSIKLTDAIITLFTKITVFLGKFQFFFNLVLFDKSKPSHLFFLTENLFK